MDYESFKAGPALDALIAERVMGESLPDYFVDHALSKILSGETIRSDLGCWVLICEYDKGDVPEWHPMPFSTDISAAWQVVEKLLRLVENQDIHIEHLSDSTEGSWGVSTCYEVGEWKDWVRAETVSLAVCIAGLKAVENRSV